MTTFTNKELIKEIKERISSLEVRDDIDRKSTRLNSSHVRTSRMPSSA